ncbi:MAG TPA: cupredoxin domain-containing protein [Usitatibacter sp.]|nr:cupredoxin domain-containing protein [Usitatibacter sp.]
MGDRRTFLLATALFATGIGGAVRAGDAPRVIKVSARRFVFTPNEITVRKGEPVIFELTTEDVFMGFDVPDFNVRSDIVPGKVMRLSLAPDKAGRFTFLCDVFCGEGHETMNGTLVVT